MRWQDKKKNMQKVNKLFEQRCLNEFAKDSIIAKINSNDRVVMTSNDLSKGIRNTEQKIHPIMPNPKPKGLWYGLGTQWIDWVRREDMSDWEHDNLYKIQLGENIIKLETEKDILGFHKHYGYATRFSYTGTLDSVNWVDVAKDYNGIEIINPRHFSDKITWLYSWDIDSGCIWNQNGLASIILMK